MHSNRGSEGFHRELRSCKDSTAKAREYVDAMPGGFDRLPKVLQVDLRVCEKGIENLEKEK